MPLLRHRLPALIALVLLALSACRPSPQLSLPNPLAEMQAEARAEWVSAAQDSSGAYDTLYTTAYSTGGKTLDIAFDLPRRTAILEWKGKPLTLPGTEAGAWMRYEDGTHTLLVGLDSLALLRKGRAQFTAGLPERPSQAYNEQGDTLHIAFGNFDDRARFVLGADTLYLREQQGLVHSQRYHGARHHYARIIGTHELVIDGTLRFTGRSVPHNESGYGYKVRTGSKKFVKWILNPRR